MRSLSTWFAYGFAVLTLAALVVAAVVNKGAPDWHWLLCGVLLGAMAIAFLSIEDISAALYLAYFKRLRRSHELMAGLQLAKSLPDDDLRRRLYIALSLHLAGARKENSAIPQVVHASRAERALPPLVRKVERRRRRRGRGRRRGGRREQGLVRVFCC